MHYFSPDLYAFFTELSANNHKDWFHANKKRYEEVVKRPFQQFVSDLIREVQAFDPDVQIEPKNAIFRINRDIRFSKDKSPYKTHVAAIVSKYGRKDKAYPGLYVHIGLDTNMIGGGAYSPDKNSLYKIRQEISYNLKEFDQLVSNPSFVQTFKEVKGDKNKIVPKEFKEDVTQQPLIANKNFYYMKELSNREVCGKDILKKTIDTFRAAQPINAFLLRAIS